MLIKYTNIEELIKKYEEQKISKQALTNFSIESQLIGYKKLLDEIQKEKEKLENLERHADLIDLKNPVRTKKEVRELIVKLMELEKSIYDRLKDFRTNNEEQGNTIVNINIRTTNPEEAEWEAMDE